MTFSSSCLGSSSYRAKSSVKLPTALGNRTQHGGEVAHFTHGHIAFDGGQTLAGGLHAQYTATALVEIAHDVAGVAVRNGDLQVADGLQIAGEPAAAQSCKRWKQRS